MVAAPAAAVTVRIAGSDLLGAPFSRALGDSARRSGAELQLELRGTRPGLEDLRSGRADAGLLFLPPGESPPAEQFFVWTIGWHAVAVVVPENSPLTRITLGQLAEAFGGVAARPGEDRPASAPLIPHALASPLSLPLFQRVVLSNGALKPEVVVNDAPAQFFPGLGASTNTIGLMPAGIAVPAGFKFLPVASDRDAPSRLPVADSPDQGDYVLQMPLQLVFRRQSVPRIADLVRFLLSGEGARALESAGLAPVPSGTRARRLFELERL